MDELENRIIVAGAGISGIRAAFDLAETGHKVLLIDKAPGYGGILPQLDNQFPDDHCGMCKMLPMVVRDPGRQFCLKKGLIHENIELMQCCEIKDVTGTPGNLNVLLNKKAIGINSDLCINCGKCEEVCMVTTTDSFNGHLSKRKAVFFPVPFQIPNNRTIDEKVCTKCGDCLKVCPEDAIDLSFENREVHLKNIPAVIMATGNKLYAPSDTDLYGFGVLKNVVTSIGFERLMSQSGPTEGKPLRPSDGKRIEKIAWIQCVGSRNIMTGSDYCSSACCMFSLKEAVFAKTKLSDPCETTIFYMDMRTHGRDFQRYRDKAVKEHGVKLVRCRVHSVEKDFDTGDVRISYMDESGDQIEKTFDLIVLATGRDSKQEFSEFTSNKAVHVINREFEFKDISETVIEASSIVSNVDTQRESFGPNRVKLSYDAPNFLVIVCNCSSKEKSRLVSDELIQQINKKPGNIKTLLLDAICSQKGFEDLTKLAADTKYNRLIIVSCTSDLFRSKINALEKRTGIHRHYIDFVEFENTMDEEQLLNRIIASHGSLKTRNTLKVRKKEAMKTALIIGAGPAGLSAAEILANHDIGVTLVEKNKEPGGNLKFITGAAEISEVNKLLSRVKELDNITIMSESEVTSYHGTAGNFTLSIGNPDGFTVLPAGAIILATGGTRKETTAYGYDNNRVMTLFDLEQKIEAVDFKARHIVMIQCVQSREEPDNYCSRICCVKALKTAIKIKEKDPEIKVTILYRDIMTYGNSEKIYTLARKNKIDFITFSREKKPVVKVLKEHSLVSLLDPVLQEQIEIKADIVSLSTGVKPYANNDLFELFDLNRTQDGFVKEADYKWRPVDTGKEGIFVCGLARMPQNASEAMKEGRAAAMRALRILSRDFIETQSVTAMVRHAICSKCELCIGACPFQARFIDPQSNLIEVDDAACQACGTCASVCPNNATVISGFEDSGVMNQIETFI